MSLNTECKHNYDRAERVGKCRYICPKCNQDISLSIFERARALQELEEKKRVK